MAYALHFPQYLEAHGFDLQQIEIESYDGETCDTKTWPEAAGTKPTVQEVADWTPPFDIGPVFAQAPVAASAAILGLKKAVWEALVGGGMDPAEATAAGVALVLRHSSALAAYEAAGGHPVAAQALYDAISSAESVAALPWLTAPILAIFAAVLTPEPA